MLDFSYSCMLLSIYLMYLEQNSVLTRLVCLLSCIFSHRGKIDEAISITVTQYIIGLN